jgi:Leucine-rich repeat (LRR) protein
MNEETKIRLSSLKQFDEPDRIFLEEIRPLFTNKKNYFLADSSSTPWFVKQIVLLDNEQLIIPESITNLKHFKNLIYHKNHGINELPEIFRYCKFLNKLDISGKESVKNLPDWIGELSNLTDIILNHLMITEIPESIGKCTQLRFLQMEYICLEILPESMENLTQLEIIHLREIPLKNLPNRFYKLNNLKIVRFIDTQFSHIPWQIGWFPHLEIFEMDESNLEEKSVQLIQKYEPYKETDDKNKIKIFQSEVRKLYPPPPEFADILIDP